MVFFARAVITGFGFAVGGLIARKLAKQLNVEDPMYPGATATVPAPPPSSSPAPAE